jgi:hypothetical protein
MKSMVSNDELFIPKRMIEGYQNAFKFFFESFELYSESGSTTLLNASLTKLNIKTPSK